MVEQGVLCKSNEIMRHWQRCSFVSKSYCPCSNADLTDPLDRLSELVANLFSLVPNRGQDPLPSIPDHPFGLDEKGVRFTLTARLCY
jgi:hypothetical protein